MVFGVWYLSVARVVKVKSEAQVKAVVSSRIDKNFMLVLFSSGGLPLLRIAVDRYGTQNSVGKDRLQIWLCTSCASSLRSSRLLPD